MAVLNTSRVSFLLNTACLELHDTKQLHSTHHIGIERYNLFLILTKSRRNIII